MNTCAKSYKVNSKQMNHSAIDTPSPWILRWAHLVKPNGSVLDVACGRGRHTHFFHQLGYPVTAVDRALEAIESIAINARYCEKVVADIENANWPFAGRQFDAVVVTNYLWRPLLPTLLASLAAGGVLLYETFAAGNETVGKPSRPDFLLQSGELLEICKGLRVVAFEEGFNSGENTKLPRFLQRIAAVRETTGNPVAVRYKLA